MQILFHKNKMTFTLLLLSIVFVFLLTTYFYLSNSYQTLEMKTNNKNIEYLIKKIDSHLAQNRVLDSFNVEKISFFNIFDTVEHFQTTQFKDIEARKFKSDILGDILVRTIKSDKIINYVEFFDKNHQLLFSLKTTASREQFIASEHSILTFIVIALFFFIVIFIVTSAYFSSIRNKIFTLQKKINQKNHQMQSALTELEKANLKLYDMAHTDFLTKIRNRRNFFIHSENCFASATRKNKDLSLIIIDIDNFKSINDKYGHDMGDLILVQISQAVMKSLQENDIFGRLQGEAFAITLFNTSLDKAIKKADFLRKEIEALEINVPTKTLKITASFGVSDIRGCKNLDQMIHKADTLLVSAKRNGKNRVRSRLSDFKNN